MIESFAPNPGLLAELRRVAAAGSRAATVAVDADAWLAQGAAPAQLHEIYAGHADDGPAAIGFATALSIAGGATPILWARTEKAERQAGRLHATGLIDLGLSPDALLLVVVADDAALLRVAADAARCSGLGTLLIESWGQASGLDLTATRRLMLAAEASGVTVLSVRIAAQPIPSAAATRWGVSAAPSKLLGAGALEADAPGHPAFIVETLRRRGGPAGACRHVEWNRETHCFDPSDDGAALSGAGIPLASGRSTARHPPAPVRRAG